MRLHKYLILMSKLSKIEGRKESVKGQYNLSTKLYLRGTVSEDEWLIKSDNYTHELKTLDAMKRSALKEYALAA